MVIQNYYELECDIMNITMKHILHRRSSVEKFRDDRRGLNRRLFNFLTISRSYSNHRENLIKRTLSPEIDCQHIKDMESRQYDESLNYRIVKELRNYVVHESHSIHQITYGGWWSQDEARNKKVMENTINIYLDLNELRRLKFKNNILEDMHEQIGEKICIKTACREYMTYFARIHAEFRQKSEQIALHSQEKLNSFKKSFYEKYPDEKSSITLAALKLDDTDNNTEIVYLKNVALKSLEDLKRRNGSLENLHRRYVSSLSTNADTDN